MPTAETEKRQRAAINQDGLLDLFGGRLAVLAGAVGVVMTVTGILLLQRFLRCSPRV